MEQAKYKPEGTQNLEKDDTLNNGYDEVAYRPNNPADMPHMS